MSYTRPMRPWKGARRRRLGHAMGDVGIGGSDPVAQLITQVNRFGPGAPSGSQVIDRAYPVSSGKVAPDVALSATVIYQRRAARAFEQFGDAGSAQAIAKANAGFADPVAFVTGNLAEVTQAIAGFADSLGIPGAGADTVSIPTSIDAIPLPLLLAGGAALLWLVTR